MGTQHWIDFYNAFAPFCAMAKQYHFYEDAVREMEKSFFEMCPLPHTYRPDEIKKVGNNVSSR
jgi:hypothetical protein